MSKKPLITIARDVSVRRSYSLSEEVAVMLDDYALFLSEFNSAKVSAGDVVDKLAARLAKDPMFVEWKKKRDPSGTRAPSETSLAGAPRSAGSPEMRASAGAGSGAKASAEPRSATGQRAGGSAISAQKDA